MSGLLSILNYEGICNVHLELQKFYNQHPNYRLILPLICTLDTKLDVGWTLQINYKLGCWLQKPIQGK